MVGKEKTNEFLELVNSCGAAVGAGNPGYDKKMIAPALQYF